MIQHKISTSYHGVIGLEIHRVVLEEYLVSFNEKWYRSLQNYNRPDAYSKWAFPGALISGSAMAPGEMI